MLVTTLAGLALSVSNLSSALDSPSGVVFSSLSSSGLSAVSDYSNDHIGNWDTGKKEKVYPVMGSKFLKMAGDTVVTKESRSSRIKSSFQFSVEGIGTLSFNYRAATYGWYDDVLLFYEDDIDEPLLELGGDTWTEKESDDGEVYYDLYAEDFWKEEEIMLDGAHYTHTVTVAVLRGYKDEDYEAPDSNTVVANLAFLDNFVWEPDPDAVICDFDISNGTEFGSEGLKVNLFSDYMNGDELTLDYWYTIDGSTPIRNGSNSRQYNGETGIMLPGTLPLGNVTVKVAAYDGSTKLGDYSQTYKRKVSVGVPYVVEASQGLLDSGITLILGCDSSGNALAYYYTLNGDTPTTASLKVEGNVIRVTSPCTVKVIASDGQEQSTEALTFTVTQAARPTYAVEMDGSVADAGTIFAEQCVITARVAAGVAAHYRVNDGVPAAYSAPLTLTSTATVQLAAAGVVNSANEVYQLNSAPIAVTVTKESANDGSWATDQVAAFQPGAWNLFAVPRMLSAPRAADLIAWLHPYGYDARRRALTQAVTLQGGAAYLVHTSLIDDAKRPSDFADGGAAAPLPGDGKNWVLSSEGAQVVWDGKNAIWEMTDDTHLPGWRR